MMLGQINGAYACNPTITRDEAIRNAPLAAMQLMVAAKAKGYDSDYSHWQSSDPW